MPYLETGYDIQLFDVGTFTLTVSCSEQGEELLRNRHFEEGTEEDEERVETIKRKAVYSQENRPGTKRAIEILKEAEGLTGSSGSDSLRDASIAGGCVYVCPTCTCFNVSDSATRWWVHEITGTWDACLHAGFYQGDQRA